MSGLCFLCQKVTVVQHASENVMLNKNLEVIFLMRQLLEIPPDICATYLKKYGNPTEWVHLCCSCLVIVNEGQKLFGKIQQLEYDLGQVRSRVQCQLKVKPEPFLAVDGNDEGELIVIPAAGLEIRSFLNDLHETVSHEFEINPDSLLTNLEDLTSFKLNNDDEYNSDQSWEIPDKKKQPTRRRKREKSFHNEPLSSIEEVQTRRRRATKICDVTKEEQGNCVTKEISECGVNATLTLDEDNDASNSVGEEGDSDYSLEMEEQVAESSSADEPDSTDYIEEQKQSRKKRKYAKQSPKEGSRQPYRRNIPCTEKDCREIFKTAGALKTHMNSVHPTVAYYPPSRVKREREIPKILNDEKTGKLGYPCLEESCRKMMMSLNYLENHIRLEHTPHSALVCAGCSIIYRDTYQYKIHLNDAKPEDGCLQAAIKCPQCEIRAGTLEALEIHKKINHILKMPEPFKCETCEKNFLSAEGLKRHIVEHANEGNSFICEKCGQVFRRVGYLRRHIKKVHGPRVTFPCRTCGKVFHRLGHRNRHEILHREGNPYSCPQCNKSFKMKSYLTIHIQGSHDPHRKRKKKGQQQDNESSQETVTPPPCSL